MASQDDDDEDDDMMVVLLMATISHGANMTCPPSEAMRIQVQRNRMGHIRRGALQNSESAPFWNVYNSNHSDAMITLCGFDYASFHALHILFKPKFEELTPYNNDGSGLIVKKKFQQDDLAYSRL